jgi:predicted secreted protein
MGTPTSTKGVDVLVTVGSDAVAAQRDAQLSVNGEPIDITTKSSAEWREILCGLKSWSITCAGLYAVTDAARTAILAAWAAGNTFSISFAVDSDTYSGTAMLAQGQIAAPHSDMATTDWTFEGTGALTLPT